MDERVPSRELDTEFMLYLIHSVRRMHKLTFYGYMYGHREATQTVRDFIASELMGGEMYDSHTS